MRLARIEGLPPAVRPIALSASLHQHINAAVPLGSTSNLRPAGDRPTVEEAEADPRMVAHWSPPADPPTEGVLDEARRKLAAAEKLCQPADPRLMAFWCGRLLGLPFAPESEAAGDGAIAAICLACADLPGAVWTNETLALALRTWTRWPAPAQVYALLAEQAKPFLRVRDGLRRVLAAVPAAQPQEPLMPPKPEERDAVHAIVEAWKAEIGYHRCQPLPPAEQRAVRPLKPVPQAELLAAYEQLAAQGDAAAAIRVNMLRQRLEEAATPVGEGETP
jgi:hypothetical protein